MTENKLRDIKIEFERIIKTAEQLKADKKVTGVKRKEILYHLKKEFTDALLSLDFVVDTHGYHESGFELEESFCHKAYDSGIIKDGDELNEIFREIFEIKHSRKTGSIIKIISLSERAAEKLGRYRDEGESWSQTIEKLIQKNL